MIQHVLPLLTPPFPPRSSPVPPPLPRNTSTLPLECYPVSFSYPLPYPAQSYLCWLVQFQGLALGSWSISLCQCCQLSVLGSPNEQDKIRIGLLIKYERIMFYYLAELQEKYYPPHPTPTPKKNTIQEKNYSSHKFTSASKRRNCTSKPFKQSRSGMLSHAVLT